MLSATLLAPDRFAEVADLLAAPQGGRWRLATSMPRGVAAALRILGDPVRVVAVRDGDRLVAVGARAIKAVRWHGRDARLGYLAVLRRVPDLPAAAAPAAMRHAFAAFAATRASDELPFDLTAIGASNHRARRLLTAGLPGVPAYRPRSIFRVRIWRRSILAARPVRLRLHMADPAEVMPLLAAGAAALCQAPPPAPLLVAEDGGLILACGRLDDQRSVRGTVLGLPPAMRALRPLANLARRARGLPAIPRPGTAIDQAFLADWHWRPGRADAALAVASALAATTAVDAIGAGWCDDHPDAAAMARLAPPAEEVAAQWYAVGADPGAGVWQLDAGGL